MNSPSILRSQHSCHWSSICYALMFLISIYSNDTSCGFHRGVYGQSMMNDTSSSPLISSRMLSPEQQTEAFEFISTKILDSTYEMFNVSRTQFESDPAVMKLRDIMLTSNTHSMFQFQLNEMLLDIFNDAHFRVEVTNNIDQYQSLNDGGNPVCFSWVYKSDATARNPSWDLVVDRCNGSATNSSPSSGMTIPGDLIVSLGGKMSDQIFQELQSTIPHENNYFLAGLPQSWLTREDFLTYFDVINEQNQTVDLVIERNGALLDIVLPLSAPKPPTSNSTDQETFVSYEILNESKTAIFQLDACIYDETYVSTMTEFWTAVLDTDTAETTVETVVIDLRNNRGGDFTVAPAFLSYITQEPYEMFAINQRNSPDLCSQAPILCDPGTVGALGSLGVNATDEVYTIPKDVLPFLFTPAVAQLDNTFEGEVVVLISGVTFSSAHLFAAAVQQRNSSNRLGTLIGTPTGNTPSFWGNLISFDVPNIDLTIYIPTSQTRLETDSLDDAIMPDIFVPTARNDILSGIDAQLEFVIASDDIGNPMITPSPSAQLPPPSFVPTTTLSPDSEDQPSSAPSMPSSSQVSFDIVSVTTVWCGFLLFLSHLVS